MYKIQPGHLSCGSMATAAGRRKRARAYKVFRECGGASLCSTPRVFQRLCRTPSAPFGKKTPPQCESKERVVFPAPVGAENTTLPRAGSFCCGVCARLVAVRAASPRRNDTTEPNTQNPPQRALYARRTHGNALHPASSHYNSTTGRTVIDGQKKRRL